MVATVYVLGALVLLMIAGAIPVAAFVALVVTFLFVNLLRLFSSPLHSYA